MAERFEWVRGASAVLALLALACGEDERFVGGEVAVGQGAAAPTTGGSAGGAGGEGGEGVQPDPAAGDPVLRSLVIEGAAVGLKPVFAPGKHRYSVLASEPANVLVATATADPELSIEIDGERVASGTPITLDAVEPESEFEVVVENSEGERNVYTVGYLPYDFPDMRVWTHEPGASSDPIYVTPKDGERFFIAKLNNDGVPLFYQRTPRNASDFKKHPTGQYSYALERVQAGNWEQVVLDENFEEVTRITSVGLVDTDAHEFKILPNGNYIVLSYEAVVHDLTEYGLSAQERIIDAILQELSPDLEVLFQWNSWDHMRFDESVYHKSDVDYSHINSVFVDEDGNWILSSRGMAQVLKVDRATGDVIWKLGGMANEFTFIDDPFEGLCGQHTASIVDNGNLLLFDNGQSCFPEVPERGELTRIVEYEIDEEAKTARLVKSYNREGAYTASQGSVQRLPNGNNFIGWGLGYEALATEVDADGNVVYEFAGYTPTRAAFSYRAQRFPD